MSVSGPSTRETTCDEEGAISDFPPHNLVLRMIQLNTRRCTATETTIEVINDVRLGVSKCLCPSKTLMAFRWKVE